MQHHFDTDLAAKYGILEAVLLDHFDFWIQHNEANDTNFHDGTYWTYNSIKAFQEIFPYVSARKIRYALETLKEAGLIKTSNFNKDPRDRTAWYALTEKGRMELQKCQMDAAKMSNGDGKNVEPLPYIYTDNKRVKERKKKAFTPPTLEEVRAYCEERNSPANPQDFYDYFTAGEWKDSMGKPVLNWKQKLITWEKSRSEKRGQSIHGNAQSGTAGREDKWASVRYDN